MGEGTNGFLSTQRKTSVLIVEDHAILRDGLQAILADYSEVKVIGEAADGIEGVRCVKELQPDLVLLDMTMPKMDGIDALLEIKKINPHTKVLVLSIHRSQSHCKKAIAAGADGYVLKDSRKAELIKAIQKVVKGHGFISKELLGDSETAEKRQSSDSLKLKIDLITRRERQVMKLLAEGHTNKQIGVMLFISPKTVDNHRANLMRKLSLHSVQELTRFAGREKLLVED
ncbi:MAG: response regulator transcription factor [Desulfobulbaceae bacterium]|nr:response regulator transcription factor [Desulfobulbaceae bacterium]